MFQAHILASGSTGNCIVFTFDDVSIMVDAGPSCKKVQEYMALEGVDQSSLKALLITHEHDDHIKGAGPVARKMGLPIHCNPLTFENIPKIGKVEFNAVNTGSSFEIGPVRITSVQTSHDAIDPVAYLFECDGKKALLATDTGYVTAPVEQALREADMVVFEANHDVRMLMNGPYPPMLKQRIRSDKGHLSNNQSGEALKKTNHFGRKVFLAHLSEHNNTPDIARETVANIMGVPRYNLDCLEFVGDTRTVEF